MDGLDDFIDSVSASLDNFFNGTDSACEDFSDLTDGTNIGDCGDDVIDALSNGNFSSHGSSDFYSSMKSALREFDSVNGTESAMYLDGIDGEVSFEGSLEHYEPFDDENREDVSFTGNGDKYTDDEYNREQAEKWFKKEEECLKKGDTSGASAAHSIAMKHQKRIKK